MLKKIINIIRNYREYDSYETKITNYLATAYPSNHTYKIRDKKIIPKSKLKNRYKKISELFSNPLESIVDIGCAKGFFVFYASQFPLCKRSLGIDVHGEDIEICHFVKQKIDNVLSKFEKMRLHDLALRINEFGGPFQTVLLINTYQYLYFGSDGYPESYLDHGLIFKNLRSICYGRVIFNNRIEIEDCQREVKKKSNSFHDHHYSRQYILDAAEEYFTVKDLGVLGRYPLWILEPKIG